jgi:two-component system response regulator HydG
MAQAAILVVEDDAEMASTLCEILRDAGYRALSAHSGAEALDMLAQDEPDLLISDLRLSGMNGHQLLAEFKRRNPSTPAIIITAFGSIENAVDSMKLGATDYLTKPFGNDELLLVVARALENRQLRRELSRLRGELARSYGLPNIIASNPRMIAAVEKIRHVADTTASVLLTGESGTGKELLARALHFGGARRDAPFVPVNCAAIPENLIESEMFGYIKGAFTDARSAKTGLFQAAEGGTLFLDEIGEMPIALQAKLLRALEDKRVRPLGSTIESPVNVRIVAATNMDLERALAEGKFRADLYYRLSMITVEIPPLRERPEDLPLLIQHFLARAAAECGRETPAIAVDANNCLMRYRWPGNVRELQNVIHSAVILSRDNQITVADVPPRVSGAHNFASSLLAEAAARRLSLAEVEREYVRLVLAQVMGNKTEAASILQIDRKTLYRKLDSEPAGVPETASSGDDR